MGIKIGLETAEKELLDKNRESGPKCTKLKLLKFLDFDFCDKISITYLHSDTDLNCLRLIT